MPLYEYECDACGAQFELIRKFSDPPVQTCSACGAEGVRKLLSSPAFQFKGSGWYVTDYARKTGESAGGAKPAGDARGEGATSATPDAAKTETKPAGDSTSTGEKPAAGAPAPATTGKDT